MFKNFTLNNLSFPLGIFLLSIGTLFTYYFPSVELERVLTFIYICLIVILLSLCTHGNKTEYLEMKNVTFFKARILLIIFNLFILLWVNWLWIFGFLFIQIMYILIKANKEE